MTRHDPRAVARAPEFDLFSPDGQRAAAHAGAQRPRDLCDTVRHPGLGPGSTVPQNDGALPSRKRGSRNKSGMTVVAARCAALSRVSPSPNHGAGRTDPASAAHAPDRRLLALRAAARGRAIRAALAAVPLHRARLLRAMVAAHRRAA
ncbi:hypothetical protein [Sphingomonas sp. BK235]|uniref:hypothetical protein n=1 Tax=Sphingomonas sp. BK235 TaxID=2512131 RepID=UPI001404777B|nr:hypothetical protein [Sphingomonas sp. BK235]